MINLELMEDSPEIQPAKQKIGFLKKIGLGGLAALTAISIAGKDKAEGDQVDVNVSEHASHTQTVTQPPEETPTTPNQQENQPQKEVEHIPFQTVMQGLEGDIEEPIERVITSQKDMDELWKIINTDPNRPSPTIKDGGAMIVKALGKKETAVGVAISLIEDSDEGIIVNSKTYDLGSVTLNKPSAHHLVSLDNYDPHKKVTYKTVAAEGEDGTNAVFKFEIGSSAWTDGSGHYYSPQTISFTPDFNN